MKEASTRIGVRYQGKFPEQERQRSYSNEHRGHMKGFSEHFIRPIWILPKPQ